MTNQQFETRFMDLEQQIAFIAQEPWSAMAVPMFAKSFRLYQVGCNYILGRQLW